MRQVMARATVVVLGGRHQGMDGVVRGWVGAGHQQRVAAGDNALGDGGDLVGGLAEAEDDLGEALALSPLVVDPGKPQVLDGLGAHFGVDGCRGLGHVQVTGSDTIEQVFEVERHWRASDLRLRATGECPKPADPETEVWSPKSARLPSHPCRQLKYNWKIISFPKGPRSPQ